MCMLNRMIGHSRRCQMPLALYSRYTAQNAKIDILIRLVLCFCPGAPTRLSTGSRGIPRGLTRTRRAPMGRPTVPTRLPTGCRGVPRDPTRARGTPMGRPAGTNDIARYDYSRTPHQNPAPKRLWFGGWKRDACMSGMLTVLSFDHEEDGGEFGKS